MQIAHPHFDDYKELVKNLNEFEKLEDLFTDSETILISKNVKEAATEIIDFLQREQQRSNNNSNK